MTQGEAIRQIRMLLRNEDYPTKDGLTLADIEAALRQEITAKRNYRGLYANCLQENLELRKKLERATASSASQEG